MASLFWVGGTGTHDNATNHYATTSGGAATVSTPTAADDVTFDNLSNATAYTVTISATLTCLNLTFGNPASGVITVAGSSSISCAGNFAWATGMTRTHTGNLTMTATTGTKTLTSNGVAFGNMSLTFNGSGGTFQLADNLTTAGGLTLTAGTFSANGKTVTMNGVAETIAGAFSGSSSFFNLTRSSSSNVATLSITASIAITNALVIDGGSATTRILISSNAPGTAITITSAANTISYADFKDITGAGAASWNLSGITGNSGDCGGNSGITFTTPATQTNTGATGNWSDVTKWTSRIPLPQDDVVINTGTGTITGNMTRLGKSIDFTGFTGTFTSSTIASIFGSLTLVSGMTLTASTQTYNMEGRDSYTFTSAGKTWSKNFNFTNPGGTYTLLDDFSSSGSFSNLTLSDGTFDANDFNVTCGAMLGNSGRVHVLNMGNGLWTITGNTTAWNGFSNFTINAENSLIKFTDSTNNGLSFFGNGSTYNNVWFARGASTGSITILGSNTFNDFKDTGTVAHSILFTAGTTQTISTWSVIGNGTGNEITINSTTTSIHTLIRANTNNHGYMDADYLNIQHSVATPLNTWYAGNNSVNNQGVATAGSGWLFDTAPPFHDLGFNKNNLRPRAFAPGLAR